MTDKREAFKSADGRIVLSIYDPTLDPDAQPEFMEDEDVEPVPDEWDVDRVRISDGPIVVSSSYDLETGESTRTEILPKDFRVLLDGRMVRGGFDATKRGGWVRFLAMRPDDDGKLSAYSNFKRKHPPGTVIEPGAVTGIAFGAVTWLVKKGVIPVSV